MNHYTTDWGGGTAVGRGHGCPAIKFRVVLLIWGHSGNALAYFSGPQWPVDSGFPGQPLPMLKLHV